MTWKRILVTVCLLAMLLAVFNGLGADAPENNEEVEVTSTRGTTRVVLAEVFTSVQCGWCPTNEEAISQLQVDEGFEKFVFVAWHGGYGTDPYEISECPGRRSYYGVGGVPASWWDGVIGDGVNSGPKGYVQETYDSYKGNIDTRRAVNAKIDVNVEAALGTDKATVDITIDKLDPIDLSSYYIRTVVCQNGIQNSGNNWDAVVMSTEEVQIGTDFTGSKLFTLEPEYNTAWPEADLMVVAWVQKGTYNSPSGSKEVLNCGMTDIFTPNTLPTLTISAPVLNDVVEGVTPITWTAADNEDAALDLDIDIFYKNDSMDWSPLAMNETNDGSYDWDTTLYGDGNYYLKVIVTDKRKGTLEQETGLIKLDNPDPPAVTLTAPVQFTKYMGDITITWNSADQEDAPGEMFASLYYTTDGTNFNIIVEDIADTGSYVWDSTVVEDGTNYIVKVVVKDSTALTAEDVMRNTFTIDNMDNPLITLQTELAGKTISGESILKWTAEDDEDSHLNMKYALYLSIDDGTTWTAVFEDENYMSQYKFDTTLQANGDYLLKVVVTDTSDLEGMDTTNGVFTIYNNGAPSLTLTAPVADEVFDGTVSITYTAIDDLDALEDLKVSYYYSLDLETWEAIAEDQIAAASYDWDVSGLSNDYYYIKVVIVDNGALTAEVISEMFEVKNNQAPEVTQMYPKGGETLPPVFTITWRASDIDKDDLKITIMSQVCADGVCFMYEALAEDLENTGSFNVPEGKLIAGDYNFKIIASEDKVDGLTAELETTSYVHVKEDAPPVEPPADDDDDDDVVVIDEDTDKDGLDDTWEMTYFGDLATADETTDSDGDGVLDITEQTSKTDPTDDTSFPQDPVLKDETQEKSSGALIAGILIALVVLIGIIVVIVVLVVLKPKKKESQAPVQPEAEQAPSPQPAVATPMGPSENQYAPPREGPMEQSYQPGRSAPAPTNYQAAGPAPQAQQVQGQQQHQLPPGPQ